MPHMLLNSLALISTVGALAPAAALSAAPGSAVRNDVKAHTLTMTDGRGRLKIRLNYAGRCVLDQIVLNGRQVVATGAGVYTGIRAGGQWATTKTNAGAPAVRVSGNAVAVDGIRFASGGVETRESWRFTVTPDGIDWRIRRTYTGGGPLEDTAFPAWEFAGANAWEGAMLNTGGVAWTRLIPPTGSYGAHANAVTFWRPGQPNALRIATSPVKGLDIASRFSRSASGELTYVQSAAPGAITPKHALRRFLGTGDDLWAPLSLGPGTVELNVKLQALPYAEVCNRGRFKGVDGPAVTELLNTIGRYGVIDRRHVTGNGWVTGFVCLHEPFYGAMAAALDDRDYTANLASSLDDWRDHAIKPDGRVMARWVYDAGMDNMVPGSFDPATGYYDCGWGYLLDAQPDYAINVAETFDLTGDMRWLRSHKASCERVLDWMLARDRDGSGLMSVMTDSHTQGKSSDWIDIVFACGKNALINAEMYQALNLWSEREQLMGDTARARRYRDAAAKLRAAFARPISEGGFWDLDKGCFAYWREGDGSVHGDNLVTPVNFCAVAYGLADSAQRKRVLDGIEAGMRQEKLFHWPLCFTSYAPDECLGMMPFPKYENGDIFLSWGEIGVRAYAAYRPGIAMKYVKLVLERHKKDGLAFQRYLRESQNGAGEDILAGNAMTIAGLYRDIFGIRPQWNRLLVDPHITPELAGTRLNYRLRGRNYGLEFAPGRTAVTVDGFTVRAPGAFAVNPSGRRIACYPGTESRAALTLGRGTAESVNVDIQSWPDSAGSACQWTETRSGAGGPSSRTISGLAPRGRFDLRVDGKSAAVVTADASGAVTLPRPQSSARYHTFNLAPIEARGVASRASVGRLTCEYLVNPLGIDTTRPRFSWIDLSNQRGYRQSAYRLIVASSPEALRQRRGDLWDTGKVPSDNTALIRYQGRPLRSRMACWWAVQVWDNHGTPSAWSAPSHFSMGLLSPTDWKGAWIGKETTDPAVTAADFAAARWIWYPEAGQPQNGAPAGARYFRTTVRLPAGRAVRRAVYRGSADNAFMCFVNGRIAGRSDDWHRLVSFDVTKLLHEGANVIAVIASNLDDHGPTPAGVVGQLQVTYADGGTSITPTNADWRASRMGPEGWATAAFDVSEWQNAVALGPFDMQPWGDITRQDALSHPDIPARYLRREFTVAKRPLRATAYLCGLGFSTLAINGKPTSDHVMDPALSDYRKAAYYVTLDVTSLIRQGRNAVGIILGNGRFYSPRIGVPIVTRNFGAPRALLQLELDFADGTRQTIVTDGQWRVTDQGPIRGNNEYDGEIYDARMQMPGWDHPGFAERRGAWSSAQVMPPPGGRLEAQMLEPMRVVGRVRPVSVTLPRPGVQIVDMGRTFYGTLRLKASAPRGTTVEMTSAYALLPDGTLKTADNRSARCTDRYVFAGQGVETWSPIFKGQGFRRVQVSGFPRKLTPANFEGLIEASDVQPVGRFECSSQLVNRIHGAMLHGMTMFLRSAPLDPDRDERQPWNGDPAKDSESEAYNFDVAAFYTKWMDDLRRSQRPDGALPDVTMYWENGNGVEWPSVYTIITDWFAGYYADPDLAQRHYEPMKRWVLAMREQHYRPDGTIQGVGFGDWCDAYTMGGAVGDNGKTPLDLVATAYQYNNVRILQRAAARAGRTDDVRMWTAMGDALRTAFLARFYDPATHTYESGTQCSYVLALAFGLTPSTPGERQAIIDNLVKDILVTHNGHLTVGLIGNQWLMQVLSDIGRPDVAWTVLNQTTPPSWGYMVKRGSDTIWERWDYETRDPGMNSQALLIQAGNVDAWLYQTPAGIHYDPNRPGFSHILLKPQVVGDLRWVRCRFNSPRGLIVSDWDRQGDVMKLRVVIPANTTASLTTPDGVTREIGSGRWTFTSRLP